MKVPSSSMCKKIYGAELSKKVLFELPLLRKSLMAKLSQTDIQMNECSILLCYTE